jgi:hypothetical protein
MLSNFAFNFNLRRYTVEHERRDDGTVWRILLATS